MYSAECVAPYRALPLPLCTLTYPTLSQAAAKRWRRDGGKVVTRTRLVHVTYELRTSYVRVTYELRTSFCASPGAQGMYAAGP